MHDANSDKGQKSVTFKLPPEIEGIRDLYIMYSPHANRASNVPVIIECKDGIKTVIVTMKENKHENGWRKLGTFTFLKGQGGITILNKDTDGFVMADAIRIVNPAEGNTMKEEKKQESITVVPANYGAKLEPVATLDMSGAMDVCAKGTYAYVAAQYNLFIVDIADPEKPVVVSKVIFGGKGRQIAVENNIAYVTARNDGLFIFDVKDPKNPKFICQYDTIELATGVQVNGSILAVAQRQYGVEFIDVSNPAKPVFISKIKTHEAQSVDIRNGYAYAGDWGAGRLTTIDISNPGIPKTVSERELQGYGDGVYVLGGLIFVSTGHHRRGVPAPKAEGDEGYGMGHGLEIYSLKDPSQPEFISRVQFPAFFDGGGFDMWSAEASGDLMYCADTFNGAFIVNIKDPKKPVVINHYNPGMVVGITAVKDYVLMACGKSGFHIAKVAGALPCERESEKPIQIPAYRAMPEKDHRVYRPGGQVRNVAFLDGYALVAAGMSGLKVVKLWPEIEEVTTIRSTANIFYVSVYKDKAYISEGLNGMSIYQYEGKGQLRKIGAFRQENMGQVRQSVACEGGNYVLVEHMNVFDIVDVSNPESPVTAASYRAGIIYYDQIGLGMIDNRYACVHCHIKGIRWLDLLRNKKEIDTGLTVNSRFTIEGGVAALGKNMLVMDRGGYRLAGPLETGIEKKPKITFGGKLLGKPSVYGTYLFVSDRITSRVGIVNISDLQKPVLIKEIGTKGNPGRAVVHEGSLLIPDAHNGLIIYDDFVRTLGLE
ncbi:MAG: hypothetical protein HZC28_06665 [Spirochaetes bacterium]|nr:hypothetical protein [Spirochaetota bacterium]